MKRQLKRIDRTLPPVRLLVEDVEHVLQLLCNGMSVEVQYDDFSYDGLGELQDHLRRDFIEELTFYARTQPLGGSLSLYILPDRVRISADHSVAERATHLADFLRSRVPWYSWYPVTSTWWYGFVGALGGSLVAAGLVLAAGLLFTNPSIVSGVLLALLWIAIVTLTVRGSPSIGRSRIFLHKGIGTPGFWDRHRDAILASIISSVIAALIGFLLGRHG